ncbi:MAG: hypothetical protein ACXAEL_11140 [Candidatus Hodarchaeales archaeon]|jgi:hypothetical protein
MNIYEKYARQIVQLLGDEWKSRTEEYQQGLYDLLRKFGNELISSYYEPKEPDEAPDLRDEIARIKERIIEKP